MYGVYQVAVRTSDRLVLLRGNALYEDDTMDEDGNFVRGAFIAGVGCPDGCVVEDVTDAVAQAIEAVLPDHGGGVTLSKDHTAITPQPEPEHNRLAREAAVAREAALDALAAHAQDHPDDPVAILARALGLPGV